MQCDRDMQLINAVQDFPYLYDKRYVDFRDSVKKHNSWNIVANSSGFSNGEAAKKRFVALRAQYTRNRRTKPKSGSGRIAEEDPIIKAMSFMDMVIQKRRMTGSANFVSTTLLPHQDDDSQLMADAASRARDKRSSSEPPLSQNMFVEEVYDDLSPSLMYQAMGDGVPQLNRDGVPQLNRDGVPPLQLEPLSPSAAEPSTSEVPPSHPDPVEPPPRSVAPAPRGTKRKAAATLPSTSGTAKRPKPAEEKPTMQESISALNIAVSTTLNKLAAKTQERPRQVDSFLSFCSTWLGNIFGRIENSPEDVLQLQRTVFEFIEGVDRATPR